LNLSLKQQHNMDNDGLWTIDQIYSTVFS